MKTFRKDQLWLMLPIILFLLLVQVACANQQDGRTSDPADPDLPEVPEEQPDRDRGTEYVQYSNGDYGMSLEMPASWVESTHNISSNIVVQNFYPPEAVQPRELPITIHAPATLTHIDVFPKGYGTELPNSDSKTLTDYSGTIPSSLNWNRQESAVMLLDDGTPWAYFLKPADPPRGWSNEGFIFAQMAINNFSTKCFDQKTGKEKPVEGCDPMGGDEMRYYGSVDPQSKQQISHILESLRWMKKGDGNNNKKQPIEDLILVRQPQPNDAVSSPVTINGMARGHWFFEADFPVKLVDKDGKVLGSAIASAEGEWMTKNFVPFSAELKFHNSTNASQAYLVFERSNPSDMRENDREYRIPVRLE